LCVCVCERERERGGGERYMGTERSMGKLTEFSEKAEPDL